MCVWLVHPICLLRFRPRGSVARSLREEEKVREFTGLLAWCRARFHFQHGHRSACVARSFVALCFAPILGHSHAFLKHGARQGVPTRKACEKPVPFCPMIFESNMHTKIMRCWPRSSTSTPVATQMSAIAR